MVFKLTLPYHLKNTTAFEGSIITVTFHPKPEEETKEEDSDDKQDDSDEEKSETEN